MTETTSTSPKILGRECKHATYVQAQDGSFDDALFVKEYEYFDDGTAVPHVRMIENYKRPFWTTLREHQNHKDKKFEEKFEKLQRHECTQRQLLHSIGRVLGYQYRDMGMASQSPFVYGTDISTPTLIKHAYSKRYPKYNGERASLNRVAALDIETDMFTDLQLPIMASLTMKEGVYLVVVKSFFKDHADPETAIRTAIDKYIGEKIKARNIKVEIDFARHDGEMCYKIIQKAHQWKPDIVSIWNINFDLKFIIGSLERHGYNLADTFSDPTVPEKYRYFRYKEGKSQKETASGKFMALHPAEQWHIAECPSSFYLLDAMCVYLRLRIAKGKESSYKLDYILKKHNCDGKLKFEEANHVKDGNWHRFMQEHYKAEYCVYNIVDCIALEELDEATTDLGRQISSMSGPSEYSKFSSQPRRTCDDLHFELLEERKVIGSTGRVMEDDFDKLTLGLKHWIVTLASHLVADVGHKGLEEMPDYATRIFRLVADLDITGTYPNGQVLMNIGRETTAKEICRIQGFTERQQRAWGINLTGGFVNAVDLCTSAFQAPTMDRLLKDFLADLAGVEPEPDPHSTMSNQMRMIIELEMEEAEEDDEEEEMEAEY